MDGCTAFFIVVIYTNVGVVSNATVRMVMMSAMMNLKTTTTTMTI